MPRKTRILVPNCPHHIVQRGHNRKVIFLAGDHYQYYLSNLKEWKQELQIKIYAWCLMTNHVHIVAEPVGDPMALSLMMKRVNGRHYAYINRLEGRSGGLWAGRYKASPIQSERYLMSCLRYVELNSVRAKMVAGPNDYNWSSYNERCGGAEQIGLDYDD